MDFSFYCASRPYLHHTSAMQMIAVSNRIPLRYRFISVRFSHLYPVTLRIGYTKCILVDTELCQHVAMEEWRR
jgi:hypothetical protein